MKRNHPFKLSAEEILFLLDAKAWEQKELAEYLGVSQATVSYWVNEKKEPNRKSQKKMVDLWDATFLQPA